MHMNEEDSDDLMEYADLLEMQIDDLKELLKRWAYWDGFCTCCGDSDMNRHEKDCEVGKAISKTIC